MVDEGLIKKSAEVYAHLGASEYQLEFGHKAKPYSCTLTFPPNRFFHLAGLHKFTDNDRLKRIGSVDALRGLIAGTLDVSDINKSEFWTQEAVSRLDAVAQLDKIVENSSLCFRYQKMKAPGSNIKANYLLIASL